MVTPDPMLVPPGHTLTYFVHTLGIGHVIMEYVIERWPSPSLLCNVSYEGG